ncbi:hypothetical protein JCGZ_15757 [Jatropha curcas]|uniref:Protein kinase domain-containing protein n=1 Tax=Jatropha curcas TaxID=180498 RepID=A0A067LA19_JATCU|nr:hypothetical protein JCGZ_15757 [Jatropha curcas]
MAKVSDFGLSRLGAITASTSHVKTQVKGTFGYLDPEYYRTRTLSKKSDVYSFGVVLYEVLCARPAVLVEEEEGKVSLAGWALECSRNGTINCIIDPSLRGKIATASLIAFVEIAVKCLSVPRTQRPAMGDVVHSLELALQAQENEDWKEEVQS